MKYHQTNLNQEVSSDESAICYRSAISDTRYAIILLGGESYSALTAQDCVCITVGWHMLL